MLQTSDPDEFNSSRLVGTPVANILHVVLCVVNRVLLQYRLEQPYKVSVGKPRCCSLCTLHMPYTKTYCTVRLTWANVCSCLQIPCQEKNILVF